MNHSVKTRRQALHQTHHHYYLNISVEAANLSDWRIESNRKKSIRQRESNRNFFCPNWNALLATNFLVIGQGVWILWWVKDYPLPLTKPVAFNTGQALPRSLWSFKAPKITLANFHNVILYRKLHIQNASCHFLLFSWLGYTWGEITIAILWVSDYGCKLPYCLWTVLHITCSCR